MLCELQAYNLSESVCLLEWSVRPTGDAADVTGFTITRDVVHGSRSTASISLPGTARQHRLTDLRPATEYTVCITMTRSGSTDTGTYVCTSVWTNEAPEQRQKDEYRRLLGIILGSIFGATLLVVVITVVVVLLRRYCAGRPQKAAAAADASLGVARARSTTSRPQVGYASKRFTKDGGGGAADKPRTVSTISGDGPGQTPSSAAFTPEERAKILAMLAATPLPGGPGPRAFANAAYDPGSSEVSADFNEHVYDAIPDQQFYDVPLDSAV